MYIYTFMYIFYFFLHAHIYRGSFWNELKEIFPSNSFLNSGHIFHASRPPNQYATRPPNILPPFSPLTAARVPERRNPLPDALFL